MLGVCLYSCVYVIFWKVWSWMIRGCGGDWDGRWLWEIVFCISGSGVVCVGCCWIIKRI